MELRIRPSRSLVALALAFSASCTFPEVTFDTTAGGGSGAGGGTTGTSTSTGGSGGNGGSTGGGTSTSTSAGGSGGGASTSSSSSTSTGGSGGTTCVSDFDDDTFISWCMGGPDCADEDVTVNPDADFDSAPIQGETKANTDPYDRNCDGNVERETAAITCKIGQCDAEGYEADVECGQLGVLGHCVPELAIGCKWEALSPTVMKQQKCK